MEYDTYVLDTMLVGDRVSDILDPEHWKSIEASLKVYQEEKHPNVNFGPWAFMHLARACTQCSDFGPQLIEHDLKLQLLQHPVLYGYALEDQKSHPVYGMLDTILIPDQSPHLKTFWTYLFSRAAQPIDDAEKTLIEACAKDMLHKIYKCPKNTRIALTQHIVNTLLDEGCTTVNPLQQELANHITFDGLDVSLDEALCICRKYQEAVPHPLIQLFAISDSDIQKQFAQQSDTLHFSRFYGHLYHIHGDEAFARLRSLLDPLDAESFTRYVQPHIPFHIFVEYQIRTGTIDFSTAKALLKSQRITQVLGGFEDAHTYGWATHILTLLPKTQIVPFLDHICPILNLRGSESPTPYGHLDYRTFFDRLLDHPSEDVRQAGFLFLLELAQEKHLLLNKVCEKRYPHYLDRDGIIDIRAFDSAALFLIEQLYPEHLPIVRSMYETGLTTIEDQLRMCFAQTSVAPALDATDVFER